MQREGVNYFSVDKLPISQTFYINFMFLIISMLFLLLQNLLDVKSVSMTGNVRFWKTNDRRKCSRRVKESNGGVVDVFKSH